jgi:hypothetical protein
MSKSEKEIEGDSSPHIDDVNMSGIGKLPIGVTFQIKFCLSF